MFLPSIGSLAPIYWNTRGAPGTANYVIVRTDVDIVHRYVGRLKPFTREVRMKRAVYIDRSKYTGPKIKEATALRGISPKKLRTP